ncbi:Fis family transcriptional regulator [Bacillus sp. V3-13]|uniref:sigma 54-interacting transcriptional regulator n=1 Tax=Bacillus sp. V3-13 TaxID=2053728 RepID=UPI000C786405|nr:sigma 54-interacting transcriptional regulator [Bacillus sp. V3-13]PLR75915.1 Fis family transcriptional regulator [Bacillus sp. V3-13]
MQKVMVKVYRKNGLHVRMAATLITKLQNEVRDQKVLKNIFVEYKGKRVEVTNLLSLVSLKIGQGEEFAICFEKEVPESILHEIQLFFGQIEQEDHRDSETDRLLMENSIILQEAIANLPNGMIVVNQENIITFANEAAIRLLEIPSNQLLNQQADQVIPHSKLHEILQTGEVRIAEKQILKNYTILANRAPIFFDGKVIGAVAIFQDVSDLEKVSLELKREKELQERLNLVLESVSDLIALTDKEGDFTYMNEQMRELLVKIGATESISGLVGKRGWQQLKVQKQSVYRVMNLLENEAFITKINPILIDGDFRGAVISLSPYNEMKSLLEKLELMEKRTEYLEQELSRHVGLDKAFQTIIGHSETLIESLSIANKVSKTNSTVLITGESGTGKELVARAIHESSKRKRGPFIRVNCAAIPYNLIESELFGHEKGAFTGAFKTHQGKFELANGGTIFLDEIGDLNIDLQAKLLRVLQEREIERVGGNRTIKLDVRVIAATNADLHRLVEEGKFRADLYYRLNIIPIHLPPLRSRKEDIPLLVDHFRQVYNGQLGKSIKFYEKGFLKAIGDYHWPGNIRELQNTIERAATLTEDTTLYRKDLPEYILNQDSSSLNIQLNGDLLPLEAYERQIFEHAAPNYPSYNQLARALGITHKTAASKLRKYQLEHLLGKNYQHS